MKNKIGWCDMTWNPVWGCLNNCEYCYARGMAKRFGRDMAEYECWYRWYKMEIAGSYRKRTFINMTEEIRNFKPIFLHSQFDKKFPKKQQRIFVGSMSEIYYWKDSWIEDVIYKINEYPQHTFQFLTKHMEVYAKWVWPKNCILGVTITKQKDFDKQRGSYYFFDGNNKTFFSFEPLLEQINIENFDTRYLKNHNVDWVIIGAETGNRKDKIIPKKEWIEDIVNYCKKENIPIYIKDSLKEIYPVEIKEFPMEVKSSD